MSEAYKRRTIAALERYYEDPSICKECNKVIEPKEGQRIHLVKKKKFCDSSCAAIFNNKIYPKRPKITHQCLGGCGEGVHRNKYCENCSPSKGKVKHLIENQRILPSDTLEEPTNVINSPKRKGELSEAKILAKLLERGYTVLQPHGDNQRYDLVVELDGLFKRIQCKTARLDDGFTLSATLCSSYSHRGRGHRGYDGEIELFAIYSPDTDKVYILGVDEVGTSVSFRLKPLQNKNNYRLAEDYEL